MKYMGLTKNSPLNLESYDQRSYVYNSYFGLATNTAKSYKQKIELLHLVCFLQKKMKKKDPDKYKNCLSLLQIIFGREFQQTESPGEDNLLIGLSIICDDLLYGTEDELEVPEGCKTLKDIKDKIINYIKNEWLPF